jgi:hypothetical protein
VVGSSGGDEEALARNWSIGFAGQQWQVVVRRSSAGSEERCARSRSISEEGKILKGSMRTALIP